MKKRLKETLIRLLAAILLIPAFVILPFTYVLFAKNPLMFVGYMLEVGTFPPKKL